MRQFPELLFFGLCRHGGRRQKIMTRTNWSRDKLKPKSGEWSWSRKWTHNPNKDLGRFHPILNPLSGGKKVLKFGYYKNLFCIDKFCRVTLSWFWQQVNIPIHYLPSLCQWETKKNRHKKWKAGLTLQWRMAVSLTAKRKFSFFVRITASNIFASICF